MQKRYKAYLLILAKLCNAIGGNVYNCCSSTNKCGLNEGDCDSNNECIGDLVCGRDNCQFPFPSDADCCEPGNFTKSLREFDM